MSQQQILEDVEKRAAKAIPTFILAFGGSAALIILLFVFGAQSLKTVDFPTERFFMTLADAYHARVMHEIKMLDANVNGDLAERIEALEAKIERLEALAHPPSKGGNSNE